MEINIEGAKNSDYEILRRIFYRERLENFYWMKKEEINLDDFDKSTKDELIYIAKIGGNIAGFISIYEKDKFIHNLFVDSDFKRKNVGKTLLDFTISKIGLPLSLKCVKKNENALKFYLALGWEIQKEVSEDEPYFLMSYIRV